MPDVSSNLSLNNQNGSDSVEIKGKKKYTKAKIAAFALVGAMLLGFATVMGVYKRGGKKTANPVLKFVREKTASALTEIAKKNENSNVNKFVRRAYTRTNGSAANVLENLTNGKDVAARGFFDWVEKKTGGKIKFYSKLDNSVTPFYKEKGLNSLTGKFKTALDKFKKLDDNILQAVKETEKSGNMQETVTYKGKTLTKKDIIEQVKQKIQSRRSLLKDSFSTEKVTSRYNGLDEYMTSEEGGLTKRVQEGFLEKIKKRDFKGIIKKPVAGDLISAKKAEHGASIDSMRKAITNSFVNVLEEQQTALENLSTAVDPNDIESLKLLSETIDLFEKSAKKNLGSKATLDETQAQLLQKVNTLRVALKKSALKNEPQKLEKVLETIDSLKGAIKGFRGGESEEIESMLRLVLDEATYDKVVKKGTRSAVGALNHACSVEKSDTFDKLRDINCGSAPTDIGNIILSAGSLGIYTAMADNNDERVGIALTTGLPILSAIGACMIGAINQISGKKVMAMGLAVSAATKVVCNSLNKMYRNARNLDENAKPSVVTIDDYMEPYVNKFEEFFFTDDEEGQGEQENENDDPTRDRHTYIPYQN